jgi:hypothetical protein
MNLSKIGCNKTFSNSPFKHLAERADPQGYQVADEEINMSLADFKAQYANNGGTVECVPPLDVLATCR